jgi:hypothetical protein
MFPLTPGRTISQLTALSGGASDFDALPSPFAPNLLQSGDRTMNLSYAIKRLREARTNLKTADADLDRAMVTESTKKRIAESATAAELEADVADAVQRANERRDAETVLSAAQRHAASARRAQEAAAAELTAAEFAARHEAHKIILIEAEVLADEIEADKAALEAKRLRLNSVRGLPGFESSVKIAVSLGDGIHIPLNAMQPLSDLDVPLNQLHLVRTAPQALKSWQDRVRELLSDGAPTESEVAAA